VPTAGVPDLGFDADGWDVRHLAPSPDWVSGLARRLKECRTELRRRSSRELAVLLGTVGARFLDPGDPIRARALAALPATSGLSSEMAAAVLDGMAYDWTPERLQEGVHADFPDAGVLDGFIGRGCRLVHAVGPELCLQVASGSVPGVGATALLRSLLVKGPTLVKPGRGDVVLPVLMAEALREADPLLGSAVAVVYWPGGRSDLERAAMKEADVVTAYGSDESVRALREQTPVHTRFVAYHHRVSLGIVGRAALAGEGRHRVASDVAGAVSFFDQRGCVSPQVLYVEDGGDVSPAGFAREVAAALERLEARLPMGGLEPHEAGAIHQLRGTVELEAATGSGAAIHHGGDRLWTVVYDPSPDLVLSCVGRVVRIKPIHDVGAVPALLSPFGDHLQTVAVAGVEAGLEALARALVSVGVSRITRFDAVPFPPPGWHHDGQGSLSALVRWADVEV
jgi:hypothetical protein